MFDLPTAPEPAQRKRMIGAYKRSPGYKYDYKKFRDLKLDLIEKGHLIYRKGVTHVTREGLAHAKANYPRE